MFLEKKNLYCFGVVLFFFVKGGKGGIIIVILFCKGGRKWGKGEEICINFIFIGDDIVWYMFG